MTLRNLLLVSYQFPPFGGSGVQRSTKLARYLPRAGWRPFVLTAAHRHYPLHDPSLLDELPGEVAVAPVHGLEPGALAALVGGHFRRGLAPAPAVDSLEDKLYWRLHQLAVALRLPEIELLWIPAAIGRARQLIRRHRIEAVVTSSPPNAAHLVGLHLKRRLGIPWIADLRDPITDNFAYQPASPLADRFTRWLERVTLSTADRVVVTCPELADRLLACWPVLHAGRVATITNGFDPADAPREMTSVRRPAGHEMDNPGPSSRGGRFILAHVGAFYRQQSVLPVLEAVRAVRMARPDLARRLKLRIVGTIAASQRSVIRDEDHAFLECPGYRQHREALQEMAGADALVLVTPPNAGGRLCIPAKTFEYLAFGGHIIAVVHPQTTLARILTEAGNVTLVGHGVPDQLAGAIEARMEAWLAGCPDVARDPDAVDCFRRDRLAYRYARLIEGCVDGVVSLRLTGDARPAEEAA